MVLGAARALVSTASSVRSDRHTRRRGLFYGSVRRGCMGKKVVELKEVDDETFDDELNEIISDHESDGFELVDQEFSTHFDPQMNRSYSSALLTFEK